ncbi:hypothetical protein ABLE93_15975 [Xanthobacter sp. KR7-65]
MRKEFKQAQRSSLKRKRGVAQYGVDVEGFNLDAEPFVVISAKCYADIRGRFLGPWVKDFTDHLGDHWKDKHVEHFVLAVSHECNDDDINDAARRITAELKASGIQFHLWHSHKITELMKDDPVLVGRYFHRHWVEAICGGSDIVVGHASIEGNSPIKSSSWAAVNLARMVATELDDMSGKLSKAWSDRLDAAICMLRRGKSSDIRKWIAEAKGEPSLWANLVPETKAKALRAAALVTLRDEDVQAASDLLDEADALAPAPDRTSAAILERSRSGSLAALDLLSEPLVPREREIKAALLIESGDAAGAVSLLESLSGDVLTAEAMRLRAIAYFILGDMRKSLNTAASAVKKGDNIAAPRFTLATLQVAAALAPGVQAQFGGTPDPIAPSLVRSDSNSLRLLSEAADMFERLLEQVDGDFRREAEIWKLAALLLHPKRQAEARRYARSLMSRDQLDPSIIAWCLHYGLPMRRGKIKKTLGDMLRRGEGTPGHVVVLALMASRLTDPRPGLAVVRRFGRMFPIASEFFAMWRRQLGEDAEAPEQDYSSAVRWAIANKNNAPLMAFLATSAASTENVVAGAEFLSSTRSYDDLFALKDRLIQIGTVRCLEMVARAANQTKNFSICLQAVEAFEGDVLPARLQLARLEAHEGLGQHSLVIANLRGMLKDGDDPRLHDRLLHAYMRIGALSELKIETEKALATRTLDSRQAVQIAFALKTASPATARLALEQISDRDFPPELSGVVLELASSLGGLEDVKEQLIRKMVSGEKGFGSVRKFETVEEILAFMQERADEYRKQFSQWLIGELPAALAMRSDVKAYSSLFLGSERTRLNNIGDPVPMLLVGHGSRQKPPEVYDNPELIVDLSGLLLSQRFGIIDDLDKAFQLVIPGALPEALFHLREQYSRPNSIIVATLADIERKASAVRVTDSAPSEALFVERLHNVSEGDEWIAQAMLEHAFLNGHMTRNEVDRVSALLAFNTQPCLKSLPPGGVRLSPHAVVDLALLDILEPVARSTPTYVEISDLNSLVKSVNLHREEEKIALSLEALQQTVADRLSSAKWKTRTDNPREEDENRFATLPSHVRCLMDTLPTDEMKAATLFWVEDRVLSKHRLPGALYLVDVLNVLIEKDILSASRWTDILREMWENGYSFISGHEQVIGRLLEQAPILDGEIIENVQLRDIRRWFAMQVENLVHIAPVVHLDADDIVLGETRLLVEMTSVLRDVLYIIWQNPRAKKEEKLARSSWAATALKLEHLPGTLGDTSPAGRRRIASMVAAQIISMPLFAELTSEPMSEQDRQLFASWAANLFDASEHADPELYNDIHDTLAGIAARILEDPPDIDNDMRLKFRALMRGKIHDFLSLLPDDWYDSIASRRGVADALGRQKITTLEVVEGVTVKLMDIPKAIEKVDGRNKKARLPIHNSKAFCRLEIDGADGCLPIVSLTVNKQRANLHPSTVALVHPDPIVRALGSKELKRVAEADRGISDEAIKELLGEPNVERRVALFDKARGGHLRRQLEGMREAVHNGLALHLSAFELPSLSDMLEFIGLSPDFSGGADKLVSEASSTLLREMGAEFAIERLSGLPFELPQSLLDEYSLQAVEPASTRPWDSPMWLITRLLATRIGPDGGATTNNIALLLQASRGIFSGLLRHASRSALRNRTWRDLPPDTMLALVWIYAEHASRALLPAGFDPSNFNSWLGQRQAATFTDYEIHRTLPRWVRDFSVSAVNRHGNLTPYRRRMLTPVWGIDPTAAERWFGAAAVGSMVAEVRRGS